MSGIFVTPARTGHVIGAYGIGSIIITRNTVSGIVCGLPTWIKSLPSPKNTPKGYPNLKAYQNSVLSSFEFHNSRIENELGIDRLISVPSVEDINDVGIYDWVIPVNRFPLIEVCNKCKHIIKTDPNSNNIYACDYNGCKFKTQQVPIVMICKKGHIDDLDPLYIVHGEGGQCSKDGNLEDIIYKSNESLLYPTLTCEKCNITIKLKDFIFGNASDEVEDYEKERGFRCTGSRPWLGTNEACEEVMRISLKNSTQVYFPNVYSSIFIPNASSLSDSVLLWLEKIKKDVTKKELVENLDKSSLLLEEARQMFEDITEEELIAHAEFLTTVKNESIISRDIKQNTLIEESKALSGSFATNDKFSKIPVLQKKKQNLSDYNSAYIGTERQICNIASVYRLSEDRVFLGFTRVNPPKYIDSHPNFKQLWDWNEEDAFKKIDKWLPAVRVYGEGIYLELNTNMLKTLNLDGLKIKSSTDIYKQDVSYKFQTAHSLAHSLINELALESGYTVSSIMDRIYDVNYGGQDKVGILIYTAGASSTGTMGGLVALSEPGLFEKILNNAIERAKWCGLDPVCINPKTHDSKKEQGACHQCLFLPETSCQYWNSGLDRALLIGRDGDNGFFI